jgi:hypothetical protein
MDVDEKIKIMIAGQAVCMIRATDYERLWPKKTP